MTKDYYKILGVEKNATADDIKKAYRKFAHKYHPDKGGSAQDVEKFKEANEAYQILSDEKKRKQYDAFSFGGGQASGWPGFGGGQAGGWDFNGFNNFTGNFEGVEFDFGDVFDQFFSGGSQQQSEARNRGRDIEMRVDVTLEEAFSGTQREVSFATEVICDVCNGKRHALDSKLKTCEVCKGVGRIKEGRDTFFGMFHNIITCEECFGTGKVPERNCKKCYGEGKFHSKKQVSAKIPAGISSHDTIKVEKQGEAGIGGTAGDLYIKVFIKDHDRFQRREYDLYSQEVVSFIQATMGGEIKIKTIDGLVDLKIPKGTQGGDLIRLRAKGMPRLRSVGRGDQYVRVKIDIPKRLSNRAKELLEELKKEGL